jgi:hypothetical protein
MRPVFDDSESKNTVHDNSSVLRGNNSLGKVLQEESIDED